MVGGGSGGTGDWEIGSMAVAGARPPGTRKEYAANGGRRAAAPTRCSIDRRADEEKRNPGRFDYQASDSENRNTPSRQAPAPV